MTRTPPSSLSLKTTKSASSSLPRLTTEEERNLLRQTTEMQRLKTLESDLAMKSPDLKLPLLSVRAKEAGYGNDLDAYENAIDDGHRAKETMITRNMGLVNYCVNEIMKSHSKSRLNSLSREDLIQEGSIGLARAVDKYNIGIGGKFSTYAVYWIRASVFRCIAENDNIVRVPEHVSGAVRKMTKAARRLGLAVHGEDVFNVHGTSSWQEANAAKALALEAGLTEKQLKEAMKAKSRRQKGGYIPFETWMQRGMDISSDVPTQSSVRVDSVKLRSELSQYLTSREMEALSLRYGLSDLDSDAEESVGGSYTDMLRQGDLYLFGPQTNEEVATTPPKQHSPGGRWGEALSFSEVGKQMSVSAEYGRRLCHKALNKLQKAVEAGQLEPTLLY
eukprot:CAMPEP_0202456758 /NCGR_PEP_ID=MMETSP1360-20130828/13940_1 /ASSEMBLY_ACC=CAM_ASM_000848 /TAXON_ID=515479 /ORGANISM="Licmophora paradoxa, Strain CCMP2313" /LENGTH=389 /DNA_ID=CAMNT_0049076655 /DNA_START=218 /DNA_END=1387 /DNA_ORIENTATION=+